MVIIGILLREENNKLYAKEELFKIISLSGGIPIGMYINNYKEYLNICNGFILPGGDDYSSSEISFIDLVYKLDKPLLGICLGMQAIGVWANGSLIDISNHLSKNIYVHDIVIDRNSLFYKIIGKDIITVNSRHKSSIFQTDLKVVAKSSDGIVEVIEAQNKKFFMGIQFHPESLIHDENSKKIFASFVEASKGE